MCGNKLLLVQNQTTGQIQDFFITGEKELLSPMFSLSRLVFMSDADLVRLNYGYQLIGDYQA